MKTAIGILDQITKNQFLELKELAHYFKSDRDFGEFCEILSKTNDMKLERKILPITFGGSPVCGLVSAQSVVKDRFIRLIEKKPQVLDELIERLQSDEIVEDWE